jgi:hypothetical protein
MKYRRLDANGDMVLGGGLAAFTIDSPETVAQAIKTRLQLWAGEWFLDTSEGTPWAQAVLGKGDVSRAGYALRSRILGTQGVQSLDFFTYAVDTDNRSLSLTAEVTTSYGAVTISEVLR